MVKQCAICNKKQFKAKKLSFSHKHHTYMQKPNLHSVKTEINGSIKRIQVCTSCLKANKVKKVV